MCPSPENEIQVRLFDVDNRLQYPSLTQVWIVPFSGVYYTSVMCFSGAKICMGARNSKRSWGVDIDASKSCSDCCYTCGQGSPPLQTLTCN